MGFKGLNPFSFFIKKERGRKEKKKKKEKREEREEGEIGEEMGDLGPTPPDSTRGRRILSTRQVFTCFISFLQSSHITFGINMILGLEPLK